MNFVLLRIVCFSLLGVCHAQKLLLAGGALKSNNVEFWETFVQMAGGKEDARIGLITAGYLDAQEQAMLLTKTLEDIYDVASVTWLPVTISDTSANNPSVTELATTLSGVFIAGGNQEWLVDTLQNKDGTDTSLLGAIRTMFQNGGTVAGTSAGAMVLTSAPFIADDTDSYTALVNGSVSLAATSGTCHRCLHFKQRGLGFLEGYIVDTHYSQKNREGRLTRTLLDTMEMATGVKKGLGIDEDMGLAIYHVGKPEAYATVIGNANGVSIIDLTNSKTTSAITTDVSNIKMSFASEDDRINMATGEMIPASWKTALRGQEWNFFSKSSSHIFSSQKPGEFYQMAKGLFDSVLGTSVISYTEEKDPGLEVVMSKARAAAFHNDSPTTHKHIISFVDMDVAIHEGK